MHVVIMCKFQNAALNEAAYVIQPREVRDGSGQVWWLKKA